MRAKKIGASDGFSVILDVEGNVYTCGKGNYVRLGHNNENDLSLFKKIPPALFDGAEIQDIAFGGRHCLATTSHLLYGWGFNFYYQLGLGIGNREDNLIPVQIKSFYSDIT